ncbi:glycoside hydrolase [Geopyxis carbonaria]|nr:glycoside hydrolase [Geopyxis carbonaria]
MSFSVPKNLPSFTASQRQLEDKVWSATFGKPKDLPLYKDKPYYSRTSAQERRRSRGRKRFGGVIAAVVLGAWWFGLFDSLLGSSIPQSKSATNTDTWEGRRERVKEVFVESWAAYERDAWGFDEYHPISKGGRQMLPKGLGWIIVDSIDTLMIMNLTTQLSNAREWVEHSLSYDQDNEVNTFETTIRMLGGLLSAHYLQEVLELVPKDKKDGDMYLDKATDLANRLLGAYDSPSGVPFASVNLETRVGKESHADGGSSSTAEATSLQLEMKYLSKLTGEALFWEKAEKVMQVIDNNGAQDGLVPIFVNPTSGSFWGTEIRLGSRGDSYYEYLIKQYLQTAKGEPVYEAMYNDAMAGMKKHLITKSHPSHLTFVGELPSGIGGSGISPKMDHLVCFVPGMLALGATHGKTLETARKAAGGTEWGTRQEEDLHLAREIMHTCYEMYNVTATKLSPEIAWFNMEHDPKHTEIDYTRDIIIKPRDAHNLQRPETVESLFVMWRITGDEIYREWGWKIFEAFVNHTKVESGGYTSLDSVIDHHAPKRDNMESFWLAETLKYLYLLFSPDDLLPLDKVVFNTEAHPLPVFEMGTRFKTGWNRLPRDLNGNIIPDERIKKEQRKSGTKI